MSASSLLARALSLSVALLLCACAQTEPAPPASSATSSENAQWIVATGDGCVAEILYPAPNEKADWSGACRNGRIDGPGRLVSTNGTRLEGRFGQGMPIDATGRVSAVGEDGRRVALAAVFTNRRGEFSPWKKSDDDVAQYGRRIAVLIRRHIALSSPVKGNPIAVVEVKTDPAGRVDSVRLAQSSGSKAWDDTVVRACWKVGALPVDDDGTVPATFELAFRPR